MFISGLCALYELDLKKVVALSTLRQLGLMIGSLSFGLYELAFFHLLTHAIFKSLLFLCSGNYIHFMISGQDMRYSGVNSRVDPIISLFFTYSALSLLGWPFLSGFYSKDLIFELLYIGRFNLFFLVIIIVGAGLTITYRVRLFYHSFQRKNLLRGILNREDYSRVYFPVGVLFFMMLFRGGGLS